MVDTVDFSDVTSQLEARVRRARAMVAAVAVAVALTVASTVMPWYRVDIAAGQLVTDAGVVVDVPALTVSANAFDVVRNGADNPYCPAAPALAGLPVPPVLAVFAFAAAVAAVTQRSVLLAGLSTFVAVNAWRQLAVLHTTVAGAETGCIVGQLTVGPGRMLSVVALTATMLLTGLTSAQLWAVRTAERKARIAAGLPVPATLVETISGRLVGVAAAVAAETQNRRSGT